MNGQELQKDDVNLVAQQASRADDRTLAELLRLAPYSGGAVQKAVIPFGTTGASGAIVTSSGAPVSVIVNPFRVIVGSRTPVATSVLDAWRDIRTAVVVGVASLSSTVPIAANVDLIHARWDLVYVAVAIDANGQSATRFQKDPTTKVVSAQTLTTTLVTVATLGVVTGVPATPPTLPTIPADTASTFYVPLAYVAVPQGTLTAQITTNTQICSVAPVVSLARACGNANLRPANSQFQVGGAALTVARMGQWPGGTRPNFYMSPEMSGGDSILVAMDFTNASASAWSHAPGAVLDNSCDWRKRVFRVFLQAGTASQPLAWEPPTAAARFVPGEAGSTQTFDQNFAWRLGQSCNDDATSSIGVAGGMLFYETPNTLSALPTGCALSAYVDAVTGAITLHVSGAPACKVFLWIDASAPFSTAS
jgi:hypothetical protein